MKKLFFVVMAATLLALTGCTTYTPNSSRTVELDGKKIAITGTEMTQARPGFTPLHTKDIKNGIYVNVTGVFSGKDDKYPNSVALIKRVLNDQGIKTTDKLESADFSFQFMVFQQLNMTAVEAASQNAQPINGMVNAGAISSMAAASGGNPYVIVGGIVGQFIPHDDKLSLMCVIDQEPVIKHIKRMMFEGDVIRPKNSEDDNTFIFTTTTTYRNSSKENETANAAELLEMGINEWINTFIIKDTPSTISTNP